MAGLDSIKKAVLGDAENETIKAGTLVTTRGIGVVAVGLIGTLVLLEQFDYGPFHGLSSREQLEFVLGAGFIWAIVAAGDAVARGLASTAGNSTIIAMPAGLKAKRTAGVDDSGWNVVAVKFSGAAGSDVAEMLVVKADKQEWVKPEDLRF